MRMLFVQTLRRGLSALLLAATLTACGPDQSQSGPATFDGSLTVSPPSVAIVVGAGAGCNMSRVDQRDYVISVFDARGFPVGNADIGISLDYSGNTTVTGVVATELIDGDSGAVVSNAGNPVPYKTQTDDSGNKSMKVRFDTSQGCTYTGQMTVVSGSLFEVSDFSLTE